MLNIHLSFGNFFNDDFEHSVCWFIFSHFYFKQPIVNDRKINPNQKTMLVALCTISELAKIVLLIDTFCLNKRRQDKKADFMRNTKKAKS